MSKEDRPEYKLTPLFIPETTEYDGFKCDSCNVHMDHDTIELSFGYGCHLDLELNQHFCSFGCLSTVAQILELEEVTNV